MNDNINNVNNPTYWDDKYLKDEFKWDIGYPTPIFKNWSQSLKNNSKIKICIPGCGRGHDALYLADKGFDVYAIDFSIEAIKYINSRALNNMIDIKTLCVDFFNLNEKFDLFFDYILEYTFYCAIHPENRLRYVDKCHNILKPNGKIIGIMLPIDINSNDGPPYEVERDELVNNFSDKFNVLTIDSSPFSIKKRSEIELYVEYEKK